MLTWARKTAGLSVADAARKAQVEASKVEAWEAGKEALSVAKLRELATAYRRPLAVFYLPEPPRDFAPLKDYRRAVLETRGASPALLYAERRAQLRREAALEVYPGLEGEPPSFDLIASLDEDPDDVGYRLRDWSGVSLNAQRKWSGKRGAYNGWRAVLEQRGVLVFQASGVPVSEMRGFSIGRYPLPVVVTNSRDSYAGRSFTLLHELSHLALRQSGVCDLREGKGRRHDEQRVEVFCNAVAAATLMPRHIFVNDPDVQGHAAGAEWSDEVLVEIASRYGTSREAVLRRLLSFGYTTRAYYRSRHEAWARENRKIRRRVGPVSQERKAIASAGRFFSRLVLDGLNQNLLSATSASEFLGVKLGVFPRVQQLLLQSPAGT